jgi:two-component system, chemotaxis family, sensor kinase CheA
MTDGEDETMIDTEILQDYSSEARELLDEMDHSLIRLEKEGDTKELLNNIFRAAHCIKGSAEYIGLERSSTLTHGMESLLDRLREGALELNPGIIDFLFRAKDTISALIQEVSEHHREKSEISPLMEELAVLIRQPATSEFEEVAPEFPPHVIPEQEEKASEDAFQSLGEEPTSGPLSDIETHEEVQEEAPSAEPTRRLEAEAVEADLEKAEDFRSGDTPAGEVTKAEITAAQAVSTLERSVPFLLNLSLYLDDLQDGLSPADVISSIQDTLHNLKETLRPVMSSDALNIIEVFENRLISLDPELETVSAQEISDLRSLLNDLRLFYPDGIFPGEGVRVPVTTAQITREEPAPAPEPSPAVSPAQESPPAEQSTGPRSMLSDVDDELLLEFEGIFVREQGPSTGAPEPPPTSGLSQRSDLLEELEYLGEDVDREIMEIFLSYGWEILDKLRPVITRISQGSANPEDLRRCAEFIKSISSSSTYMDYQNLASFLEEWYEKTLWASEQLPAIETRELEFMEGSLLRFQEYLTGLEAVLSPREAGEPQAQLSQDGEVRDEAATPQTFTPSGPEIEQREQVASTGPPREGFIPEVSGPPSQITAELGEPGKFAAEPWDRSLQTERKPGEAPPGVTTAERQAETPSEVTTAESREGRLPVDLAPETGLVRTMRVDATKVDILLNQVGELVVNRSYVEQLTSRLKNFQRALVPGTVVGKRELLAMKELTLQVGEASLSLGRVANDIQEGVMKLRMLPVGQLFNRMPRLVRDLSRRVSKVVGLQVFGGDTEVDKRVIEQIYNPLVHLIRNAVDHGIEEPEVRKSSGKNEEGSIVLRAYSQGNQVVVDIEDDGGGIDSQAVISRAVEVGLLDQNDAKSLGPQDIYNFLFVPGFSTSKRVTRTSGRGVGMDVVKKDVEKINGHIEIESWEKYGTRISIRIPLTLAIIQTLLIRVASHVFAIPLTAVREIIQISPYEIGTIEGFEVIKFREETIPVLRIDELFKIKQHQAPEGPGFLVLASAGTRCVGLLVEQLIGEQDVVIKPLAEHVCEIRGLAGSTILGDGTIALVLDVTEMIEDVMARQRQLVAASVRFIDMQNSNRHDQSLDA